MTPTVTPTFLGVVRRVRKDCHFAILVVVIATAAPALPVDRGVQPAQGLQVIEHEVCVHSR